MISSLFWTVSKIADTDVIGTADLLALIVEESTAEHGLPLLAFAGDRLCIQNTGQENQRPSCFVTDILSVT
jgi:hypothetical protein